ncbi:4-hydroxy-tetrahydrodipicolinate reductase [Salinisphaera sp. SPP-AMP-43]|uniref:4-hydroxy-tetrahydrodipicolinate reductase n=1 Tax=Salinisphaera sp. SPP-AMP-43 TaxID=3121288 RepID=UPI003C6E40BC
MSRRIAINGASGRMGRELIIACGQRDDLTLVAAFASPDSDQLGIDAGRLAGIAEIGIELSGSNTMADTAFDVLVDFSLPEPSIAALEVCRAQKAAMVIGTTGYAREQQAAIDAAVADIAIVQAPNYSAGVNLSLDLVRRAASALGDEVDIEIIEAHHRHKVDAPSGTALKLGEVAAEATGRDLDECAVYARQGHTGARERRSIGFSTVRGGDIVGEHTVMFAGAGERIEITHKASSRQTFAGGAIRAAVWAAEQGPGRYDMNDVLGLG